MFVNFLFSSLFLLLLESSFHILYSISLVLLDIIIAFVTQSFLGFMMLVLLLPSLKPYICLVHQYHRNYSSINYIILKIINYPFWLIYLISYPFWLIGIVVTAYRRLRVTWDLRSWRSVLYWCCRPHVTCDLRSCWVSTCKSRFPYLCSSLEL